MSTITVQDIERDPAGFLLRVQAGESLVVLNNNQPVAEITPVAGALTQQRPYGLCAGQFVVPQDFDAPLPDDVLDSFETP